MDISVSAGSAHRREQARRTDGRFGQQQFARAAYVDLNWGDSPRQEQADSEAGAETWYDAGSGETVLETSSQLSAPHVMGISEEDPRFEEGSRVLRSVVARRHPDARVDASRATWDVQFTTRVHGMLPADEAVEAAEGDLRGAYALRADLDAPLGEAGLRGDFLRRMRGSVLLPVSSEGSTDTDDDREYRAYCRGEEVAPPPDELARSYAEELSIDGVEISRLAEGGAASAVEIDYELAMCPQGPSRTAFRARQLRRWLAIRHAETMRRWS